MPPKATWKFYKQKGELDTDERNELPENAFAFPKQHKEPLTDAAHVRNAIARFDQVEGVSDADREQAFANIMAAAKHFGVGIEADSWRDLGKPSGKAKKETSKSR